MSLQVAILKVLASYPEGRATLKALNADLAILNTSGPDWTDRMKRLAAMAPDLDVFSQGFVIRDNAGWQITETGRTFIHCLEASSRLNDRSASFELTVERPAPPDLPAPQLLLVGVKRRQRKAKRGRFADPRRRRA
jgi:hypothetical protein